MTVTVTLRNVLIRLRIVCKGPAHTIHYSTELMPTVPFLTCNDGSNTIVIPVHILYFCRKISKNLKSIEDYLRIPFKFLGQG